MDPVWLLIALLFGLGARQLGLPPLVGFLVAGFVLNAFGEQGGEILEFAANIGVLLLLFTIGLKLRLDSQIRITLAQTIHICLIAHLFIPAKQWAQRFRHGLQILFQWQLRVSDLPPHH